MILQSCPKLMNTFQAFGTFLVAQMAKNPPANAGDTGDVGSIPELGQSPGEGNVSPLQYSCLENPMDRGAWRATVHGVAKKSVTSELLTVQAFICLYWLIIRHGKETWTCVIWLSDQGEFLERNSDLVFQSSIILEDWEIESFSMRGVNLSTASLI